jgi:DNA repair photolyase
MGMTNINQIGKGLQNNNILTAKKLFHAGIKVWVFVTPFLPYIMNFDEVISKLDSEIPIFLDKLRINKNTIQSQKMMKFISQNYPEYIEKYKKIINENDENYYNDLIEKYGNNERIRILFGM